MKNQHVHRLTEEHALEITPVVLGTIGPAVPGDVVDGLEVLTGNSIGTWTDNMGGSGQ